MKQVDATQALLISDLINEQELDIAEFAMEKDFIVSSALHALEKIQHPLFDLVFCGGTCLSKAYGILERISEDVDIKVVIKSGMDRPSKSKLKTELSALKAIVIKELGLAGFNENDIQKITARDGNTYVEFEIAYQSYFPLVDEIRPHLKLELNFTDMVLPYKSKEIGLLFDKLSGNSKTMETFSMPCIDVAEAVVEKLISFPRRLSMHLNDSSRALDHTLVRHLYDVHEIANQMPDVLRNHELLVDLMEHAMEKDAKDFATQHPQFLSEPVTQLRQAMEFAKSDPSIESMYNHFLKIMVYEKTPPTFERAISVFDQALMTAMPREDIHFLQFQQKTAVQRGPKLGM